ncbi:MAG: hypothetical protein ACK40O_09970 [Allosphingosinicella sp.]
MTADPLHHGYSPIYRDGEVNHCPGCGQRQWIIGRITAECPFCATAIPLQRTGLGGIGLGALYWDRDIYRHGWHTGPVRHSCEATDFEWDVC